jgi:predicted nucleic acid-binding protein
MTTLGKPNTRGHAGQGGVAPLFVDTSGWVCLADADQPSHQETTNVYQRARAQRRRLVTTNYIIAEIVALLGSRTRIPRQDLIAFIDRLKTASDVQIVHISEAQDAEAWALLKARVDKDWSLVDASSFVVMPMLGIVEALTTDHHFLQAGFVRLPVQPAQPS